MKISISTVNKKLRVHVVVDYVDMRFSKFAIEYLPENKKVCETVFACSYGAQVESFKSYRQQNQVRVANAIFIFFYIRKNKNHTFLLINLIVYFLLKIKQKFSIVKKNK